MFYSGHFSFDEMGEKGNPRHGYFTSLVKAENPQQAAEKFKKQIVALKRSNYLFSNILAVYVEDIVEIIEIPDDPIVIRYQSSAGEFPKSVSCSLPSIETPKIEAYKWVPDGHKGTEENMTDEYEEAKPFLIFDERA
jgi:hypothetical protein